MTLVSVSQLFFFAILLFTQVLFARETGEKTPILVQSFTCPHNCEILHKIAREGLNKNVVEYEKKDYLTAGATQLRSLWTRDFSYSVPGLLAIQRPDIVKNQIELILSLQQADGNLPKGIDSMNLEARIIRFTLRRMVKLPTVTLPFAKSGPLKAIYQDALGSKASDSGLLILMGMADYDKANRSSKLNLTKSLMLEHQFQAFKLFQNIQKMKGEDGLLYQMAHSDWQDSVKRGGATFLTNLLYLRVLKSLQAYPLFAIQDDEIKIFERKLHQKFWNEKAGLYQSLAHGPWISVEGNLYALDWGIITGEKAQELYANLKKHPLWSGLTGFPGFATFPSYPRQEKAFHVKLVNLAGYHDELYWSWLMAMAAKIAFQIGDREEGERIISKMQELAMRDQTIREVYQHRPELTSYNSWAFASEGPFSWGCAKILEMLAERDRFNPSLPF